jgi:hypothetical protein
VGPARGGASQDERTNTISVIHRHPLRDTPAH